MIKYTTFEFVAFSIWLGFMFYYMYNSDSYGMAASLFMLVLISAGISIKSLHEALRTEIEEDEKEKYIVYKNHE